MNVLPALHVSCKRTFYDYTLYGYCNALCLTVNESDTRKDRYCYDSILE